MIPVIVALVFAPVESPVIVFPEIERTSVETVLAFIPRIICAPVEPAAPVADSVLIVLFEIDELGVEAPTLVIPVIVATDVPVIFVTESPDTVFELAVIIEVLIDIPVKVTAAPPPVTELLVTVLLVMLRFKVVDEAVEVKQFIVPVLPLVFPVTVFEFKATVLVAGEPV
jgi:hypothetical protein